ncbi:MAG: hypothetical protein N2169_07640 [bacterium]|nr:hypothetical protein [bacterium]
MLKKYFCFLIIFSLYFALPNFLSAQDEDKADNPPEKVQENIQESTSDTEQAPTDKQGEEEVNIPGDVIYLKSGKKMKGVQVLRELPDKIEVQISENMEPLILPRRLVQNIEYDNIDPLREKRQKEILSKSPTNEDIIAGEELSQEFNQKMRAPLSDQPIVYDNQGLLVILNELANKVGVKLEVDDSIKTIPGEQRRKSFQIPPGTSLYKFLQTDFASAYPMVSVTYKYDKIYISLKSSPNLSQPSQPPTPPPATDTVPPPAPPSQQ